MAVGAATMGLSLIGSPQNGAGCGEAEGVRAWQRQDIVASGWTIGPESSVAKPRYRFLKQQRHWRAVQRISPPPRNHVLLLRLMR